MDHDFSRVDSEKIPRSKFVRPYTHKTTIDAGYLYPLVVDEILPGDVLDVRCTLVGRILSFLYPLMDNLMLSQFWFFCPSRLLWDNWEKFMGARENPGDSIDFLIPTVDTSEGWTPQEGSIADYLGMPVGIEFALTERINALPFRMYNLVWNEWFRDTQLQDSVTVLKDDGPDPTGTYGYGTGLPLRRGKRHDYFTSCRLAPQLGDAVALPISGFSDVGVIGDGSALGLTATYGSGDVRAMGRYNGPGGAGEEVLGQSSSLTTSLPAVGAAFSPLTSGSTVHIGVQSEIDLSGLLAKTSLLTSTAVTINELREAFAVQQIRELDSRGGTRYVEQLKQVFGVISPDFRLQRPEYLGGSRQRIDLRSVAQTTANPTTPTLADNKGSIAANGEVISQARANYSAVEHGYLMCLVSIDADLTYQYGLRKMWSRSTRFDFYRPELAHLGEQAVLNKEIFYPDSGTNADGVFGYQERWAEYRYFPSMITGKLRSSVSGTLDAWHLSEIETAIPVLDDQWIQSDPPMDRVIAVPSEPHMIIDVFADIGHVRPIPVYSTPGMRRL